MGKTNKRFIPPQLVISKENILKICHEFIESNRYFAGFVFLLGLTIPIVIDFFKSVTKNQDTLKYEYSVFYLSLSIAFSVACLIFGYIAYYKHEKSSLFDVICDNALDNSKYTAIFVIAKRNQKTPMIELLTTYYSSNSQDMIFLPYIDVDPKEPLSSLESLTARLSERIGVQKNQVLKLSPINKDSIISIKPLYQKNHRLIRYEFFNVELRKELINDIPPNYSWMSLEELCRNPNSMTYNHDVIDYLRNSQEHITDSFHRDVKRESLKIIWNITKECGYDCAICATFDPSRKELTYSEKASVLLKIITSGYNINRIDFAGGDPLTNEDSRKIIGQAIKLLGYDIISITTTSKGIACLTDPEKRNLLRQCEITIDTGDFGKTDSRRKEDTYSIENFAEINMNKHYFKNLCINIPILETNIDEEFVKQLSIKIRDIDINNKSVSLLRLMPVGKMNKENYPTDYHPEQAVKLLTEELKKDMEVHIHCALRGKINGDNNNCLMATKKIGIDCAGNVYSCAWAAYLNIKREHNPFYLGNLLKEDFDAIMKKNKSVQIPIRLKYNEGHCCIFSYLYSGSEKSAENRMFSKLDPIISKTVLK